MKKIRFTLKAFAFLVFTLACASAANAQATRTWVSGVGDDVNPCSRTAPCKTFAGAISKTANGGEIDALDPGGFGTVTITKNMTIDGTKGQGFGSILAAGTTGVNVNDGATATPNTIIVTLRNLSINGASTGTNGVTMSAGKRLNIEDCQIFGFATNAINANLTTASATEIHVTNTTIFNCQQGIRLSSTLGGSFVAATIKNVKIGRITADAIRLDTNGIADVIDSTISFAANGINVTGGAGSGASIINSSILRCTTGINAAGGTSRIMHSSIIANVTGIAFSGGGVVRTLGDNNFDGNPTPFSGGGLTGIGGKL